MAKLKSISELVKVKFLVAFACLTLSPIYLSGCIGVDGDSLPEKEANEEVVDAGGQQGNNDQSGGDNESPVARIGESLSRLSTSGIYWVNEQDEVVNLRGVNLGNWLLQEFWMMEQPSDAGIHDQCTLEATLTERFGKQEQERLIALFQDNWMQERDWDLMQGFGMNVIRLPFIFSLLEDVNNPYHLREDAWFYLDRAIEQASARGMYTILDLHGAAGSQGWQDHAGCANKNEYWGNETYKDRTRWLWQQIAERYKNSPAVAGYNLLNEPWGTEPGPMVAEITLIHDAVREVDSDTIIILNGHHQGIDAYGNPHDKGMVNIAFDMHFYPGIFGWGQIGYNVHRDWLTCGEDGTGGVCAWAAKMESIQSPLLVGEFQPWTGMGELSGQNTRATYDKYNELGWAATGWAWKTVSKNGGIGSWGLVSNKGEQLISKFSSWDCAAGAESSLSQGCAIGLETVSNNSSADKDMYLLVKGGSCCEGQLDVALDKLGLIEVESGVDIVANGEFGSEAGWITWFVDSSPDIDFNYQGASAPAGSSGEVLRLSGSADINGGVYQKVTLEAGKTYQVNGVMKDVASNAAWLEVYLVAEEPQMGKDVLGEAMSYVDFATASLEEIEGYYRQFGEQQYVIEENVLAWMNAEQGPTLYSLPSTPQNVTLQKVADGYALTWDANSDTDLKGYRVYRAESENGNAQVIAELIQTTTYTDTSMLQEGTRYYYWVSAIDAEDESYASSKQSILTSARAIPGVIQVEGYDAMLGVATETTSDTGGGSNIGFIDGGDWVEFEVDVESSGSYEVAYRVATEHDSGALQMLLNGEVVDAKTFSSTGGWQQWTTVTSTVDLTAGIQTMRLNFTSGAFNFNWVSFSKN